MAVKIRLAQRGRKKRITFDVVIADSRAPRDGRFIEKIGLYNPLTNPASIDIKEDRAFHWLMNGAQPSYTVKAMLSYRGIMLKKHLQIGVLKSALTQEQADAKLTEWQKEKDNKIQAKQDKLAKNQQDIAKSRKDAERKVKEARTETIRKKELVDVTSADAEQLKTAATEQPVAAKKEQPAAAKKEQPAAAKEEQPVAAKEEQPAAAKKEQPAAAKKEQPAAAKKEQPAAAKEEQPAAAKEEQPAAAKEEQPAAAKKEQPAAAKKEQPAAAKEEQPAAAKKEQPADTKSEVASKKADTDKKPSSSTPPDVDTAEKKQSPDSALGEQSSPAKEDSATS